MGHSLKNQHFRTARLFSEAAIKSTFLLAYTENSDFDLSAKTDDTAKWDKKVGGRTFCVALQNANRAGETAPMLTVAVAVP